MLSVRPTPRLGVLFVTVHLGWCERGQPGVRHCWVHVDPCEPPRSRPRTIPARERYSLYQNRPNALSERRSQHQATLSSAHVPADSDLYATFVPALGAARSCPPRLASEAGRLPLGERSTAIETDPGNPVILKRPATSLPRAARAEEPALTRGGPQGGKGGRWSLCLSTAPCWVTWGGGAAEGAWGGREGGSVEPLFLHRPMHL